MVLCFAVGKYPDGYVTEEARQELESFVTDATAALRGGIHDTAAVKPSHRHLQALDTQGLSTGEAGGYNAHNATVARWCRRHVGQCDAPRTFLFERSMHGSFQQACIMYEH
jgi:hypothetical protein